MRLGSPGSSPYHRSLRQRMEASLLLGAMFVGCQLLWLGVPAVSLWGLSRFVTTASEYLLGSVILVPTALGAFGCLLGLANSRYLKISAPPIEDDEEMPRLHGPLESILPASVVVAVIALLIWIAVFSHHVSLALE
jgi:hypothetical protein